MARETTIERRIWKGEIVTVIGKGDKRGHTMIRDGYGFPQSVPNKQLSKLREDDTRASYTIKEDGA